MGQANERMGEHNDYCLVYDDFEKLPPQLKMHFDAVRHSVHYYLFPIIKIYDIYFNY